MKKQKTTVVIRKEQEKKTEEKRGPVIQHQAQKKTKIQVPPQETSMSITALAEFDSGLGFVPYTGANGGIVETIPWENQHGWGRLFALNLFWFSFSLEFKFVKHVE